MSSRITPPSADTDSTSRRRWTLVTAAIILALIAVAAIVALLTSGNDDQGAPPAPTPNPTATGSASVPTEEPTPTTSGPQRCNLPAGDQTIPTTPIHGAQWSLVNRVAVPEAPAYGPQLRDSDGLRRCFAHSPTGAVYALYNYIAAMSPKNDNSGEQTFAVLRRIMTPGPNRDRYIEWLRTAEDPNPGDDTSVQLAGFKVIDATADRASILIAAQAGNGYASSTWTLTWQGDDWRVVAPKPGEMAGDPYTTIPDLTGFVPWQGA